MNPSKAIKVGPLHCDKISLTMKVPFEDQHGLLKKLDALIEGHWAFETSTPSYLYQRSINFFMDGPDSPEKLLIQCAPKSLQKGFLRLELNPSRVHMGEFRGVINHLIPGGYGSFVKRATCTRVDVTVDVNHQAIDDLIFWKDKVRKTCCHYGNSKTETIYLGTRQSPRQICIYDKQAQLRRKYGSSVLVPKHPVTRVEARIKDGVGFSALPKTPNPFKGMGIAGYAALCKQHPDLYLFLRAAQGSNGQDLLLSIPDKYERKKYRELLNQGMTDWWNPDDLWEQWPEVTQVLLSPPPPPYSLDVPKHLPLVS